MSDYMANVASGELGFQGPSAPFSDYEMLLFHEQCVTLVTSCFVSQPFLDCLLSGFTLLLVRTWSVMGGLKVY